MISKKESPQLITTEEAVTLCIKFATLDDVYTAEDIYLAYMDKVKDTRDESYAEMCALAAIYSAGRIQGIREERAKRRHRNE